MEVLPYLAIAGSGCDREILNNCRTLAYMRANKYATVRYTSVDGWESNGDDCGECCCPSFDDGNYSYPANCDGNPAPWFNANIPATAEAYGLLVESIEVEADDSARVVSEGGTPRITITGRALAGSRRGLNAYLRWLKGELNNCCAGCGGLHLSLFDHCAPLADSCAPGADFYRPPLDLSSDEPDAVISPPANAWTDDGKRGLVRVRYLSLDPMTDDAPLPGCKSQKIVIQLEMNQPEMFGREIFCCTIDTFMGCEPGPQPWDYENPVAGCETCGLPCRCVNEPVFTDEDDSLPDVDQLVLEPSNTDPLQPKPLIEPAPPDCPPIIQCAQKYDLQVDALGFIPSPVPAGTWSYSISAASTGNTAVDNWLGWIAECGGGSTIADIISECVGNGGSSAGGVVIETHVGGAVRVRVLSASGGSFCDSGGACQTEFLDPLGTNYSAGINAAVLFGGSTGCQSSAGRITPGPNPIPADALECLFGCTPVSPTMDGEPLAEGFLYPFPLIYNGSLVNDGNALAALLSAERGCVITWTDEFDSDNPCTYCLPNDCPREVVADLATPPDYVSPLVDGVQGVCPIPWPLIYKGQSVADGDEFAALLSEEKGCLVEWIDEFDLVNPCTYRLVLGCDRGAVAQLTSAGEVTVDEECFQVPAEVRRGACYIPAMPAGLTTSLEIEMCNTTQPIENATIAIYAARKGAPHILNRPVGGPLYHSIRPVLEAQIAGMAAHSTLILDGREGTLTLSCIDGSSQNAAGVVTAPGRKPARVPTLGCGPHWVEVRLDCANAGDLDQKVNIRLTPVLDPT